MRNRSKHPELFQSLVGVFVALAVLVTACDDVRPRFVVSKPKQPTDRPTESNIGDYVSSDTCRSCHPGAYDSWHDTYHRTMTQEVTPETVLAPWDGEVLTYDDKVFKLERRGDEYWVELPDPEYRAHKDTEGLGPERVWRQAVLATGSHHFQAFWVTSTATRKLSILLMCYRLDEQRWMPMDAAFLAPPVVKRESGIGRWNRDCQKCHSTRPRPRIDGPRRMDTHVVEFGISCESCHGPGGPHVEANQGPLARYANRFDDSKDDTIVNPPDLGPDLGSQVCGQCHGMLKPGNAAVEHYQRRGGLKYRPGHSLFPEQVLQTEGSLYFWPDGEVRVSGREYQGMLQSPCYEEADPEEHATDPHGSRQMSCFSCHQMHRSDDDPRPLEEWRDDLLFPGMRGNLACTQCHPSYAEPEALAAHTHHAPDSIGSNCMDCHMPHTAWGLLKSSRSHEVTSPSVFPDLEVGRPNACNLCHLDRSLEWTAGKLEEWYGTEPPTASELRHEHKSLSAAALYALRGDAGQRSLIAWHMGQGNAQGTTGPDWFAPYLAHLLMDPYDAVRFAAYRSLKTLAGFGELDYDFVGPEEERPVATQRVMELWSPAAERDPGILRGLLLRPDGSLDAAAFAREALQRNDEDVILAE